jgi:hypothetical protein
LATLDEETGKEGGTYCKVGLKRDRYQFKLLATLDEETEKEKGYQVGQKRDRYHFKLLAT